MMSLDIHSAQPSDCDLILRFARETTALGPHLPSLDVLHDAITARRAYLIHDTHGLAGIAATIWHYGDNPAVEAPWREVSVLHVSPPGFGLHKVLLAAAAVSEAVFSPGADAIFATVPQSSIPETSRYISAGFVPWIPPAKAIAAWQASRQDYPLSGNGEISSSANLDTEDYHFLYAPPESLSQLAYSLLQWDTPDSLLIRPASRAHGAAKPAHLRLYLDCLRSHRNAIQRLSQIDYTYHKLISPGP